MDPANALEDNKVKQKPLFVDLDPDDEDQIVSEIESLCLNCHDQGMTRLMLTRIPFFREVILSSFQCDVCGHSDRDIQDGGKIQDKGVRYEVKIQNTRDLNRQVIKSDNTMFAIPSLEFEQPAGKKGEINTVEGLIGGIIAGLQQEQPIRKALYPDVAVKIESFIERLQKLKVLSEPFTIVLDDPSGNSFVENPTAPKKDEATKVEHYTRSDAQEKQLGLKADDDDEEFASDDVSAETGDKSASDDHNQPDKEATAPDQPASSAAEVDITENKAQGAEAKEQNIPDQPSANDVGVDEDKLNLKDEVLTFPTNCHNCSAPCQTNMKLVDIPFFKQVIIMATCCDACGSRDSEVKGGAGVEDKGTKITLKVTDPSDLNRDVLKSDSCGVRIPEIELELMEGTLGGRFTTVEGLLQQIRTELYTKNPFFMGDGAALDTKSRLEEFLVKLDALISGKHFTLILDDPAGNSYLQNTYAPDDDPEMSVEHYIRSDEQDDCLGLSGLKTENYTEQS